MRPAPCIQFPERLDGSSLFFQRPLTCIELDTFRACSQHCDGTTYQLANDYFVIWFALMRGVSFAYLIF